MPEKRLVSESLVSEMKIVDKESNSPALCVMEGPCMEFDKVNRNNRIYSKKLVEDRIINNPAVQEALKNKSMLGEGGHPETRVDISYPDVALCVEKLWIPKDSKGLLWGRFAILDTPVGRILETLVRYGSSIGISARALTDSVEKGGHEIISETTYDLITFDAVPDPGFKCARLSKVESAMRPMDSMSMDDLRRASSYLKSARMPAFESRIRMLDKEIDRRKSFDLASELEELKESLSMLRKQYSLSKVEEVDELISSARSLMEETKATLEARGKVQKEITEEVENLYSENKSLREEIKRLDSMLYSRSLSPDYQYQTERFNRLLSRLDNLNTDVASITESRNVKDFSSRYCVKESRVRELLSKTNEGINTRDSQKIAQFERDPNDILRPNDSIEPIEDSLTRAIHAQIRR